MGVPETVGVEADLFLLVEEEWMIRILAKKGTEVIEDTCPL
jgi:hypothetical protein